MQSRREERERENKTTCGGVGECGCFVRIELLGWLGWAGLGNGDRIQPEAAFTPSQGWFCKLRLPFVILQSPHTKRYRPLIHYSFCYPSLPVHPIRIFGISSCLDAPLTNYTLQA
jgi:hypothetical protein